MATTEPSRIGLTAESLHTATWRNKLCVVVAATALCYLSEPPRPEVDCVPAPYTAWSLIRHGDFDIGRFAELDHLRHHVLKPARGHQWVSKYPVGTALTSLPTILPFAMVRPEPPSVSRMARLGKLTSVVWFVGSSLLMYLILTEFTPKSATPTWWLFTAGTLLTSIAAQACWAHGPATFCLVFALRQLLKEGFSANRTGQLIVGFALGLAVLTRPTTVLFATATFALLIRHPRAAVSVLSSFLPTTLLLPLYNWHHFGTPFSTGYGAEAATWTTPLLEGLSGLLISPSRGLLVFTPAFLLIPYGLWRVSHVVQPHRNVLIAWSIASLATFLLYAHWHCWWGGWCYGPRFLAETIPTLCLLVAIAIDSMPSRQYRRIVWPLVTLSILIQYVGLFGYANYADWHRNHTTSLSMFNYRGSLIEVHARALFQSPATPPENVRTTTAR